jgi:hypothetical protein
MTYLILYLLGVLTPVLIYGYVKREELLAKLKEKL